MTAAIAPAPCRHCPFRKDVPIYLRRTRRAEIAHALVNGGSFPCHATVDYGDPEDAEEAWEEDYGDYGDPSGASMCAGAAKAMMLDGASTQIMRVSERLGLVDLDRTADRGAEVWGLLEWQTLGEGSTADAPVEDLEEEEIETCNTVEAGCLAPAGFAGFNGGISLGTVAANGRCSECDDPLCTACGGVSMLCSMCRPWDDDE